MRLGKVLADHRYATRVGVREIADEIGISAATLSRIENGGECEARILIKILTWLFSEEKAPPK
jgi:transcriptional regulator with XRE-family HTH domain